MNAWLFTSLPLLLAGEIPQGPQAGNAVPGMGGVPPVVSPGTVSSNRGGSAEGAGNGGAPSDPPVAVPAPPGQIQPTEFYQIDPNDPDSRVNGIQMREGWARVRQFDALQSDHHRTLNELQAERAARQQMEAQLRQIQEQERFQNYLAQSGMQPPVANPTALPSQPPGQYQPVAPPPGQQFGVAGVPQGEAADDWMLEYGIDQPNQPNPMDANGYYVPQGQGTVNWQQPGPGQVTVPQTPGQTPALDSRQLVSAVTTIMEQKNQQLMNQLQQNLLNMVENTVGRRFAQQAQQDGVRSQFSGARQQLSNELQQKYGITPERNRDILDKFYLSQAGYEEASRLMSQNYQDPQQERTAKELATQKLAQSNAFFSSAVQDALDAAGEAQQLRQTQEARDMLMTGSYVDLGDLQQPNYQITDPMQIQQQNMANLQKAQEIAMMNQRLQAAAGAQPATPGLF